MPSYPIKQESELKKELNGNPKGEDIQYALNLRRELRNYYNTIVDLTRDISHHKHLNWKMAELLEKQANYLIKSIDLEVTLVKMKVKEQIKSLIESL